MQRRFKISVEGRDYDVVVEEILDDSSDLYPDRGAMRSISAEQSRPVSAPVSPSTNPSPTPQTAGPGDVVSPLAGVVLSIDVEVGTAVEPDTRVITLEAMKTKTIVAAGREGKVSAIAVTAGEGVEAGQPLLTIA